METAGFWDKLGDIALKFAERATPGQVIAMAGLVLCYLLIRQALTIMGEPQNVAKAFEALKWRAEFWHRKAVTEGERASREREAARRERAQADREERRGALDILPGGRDEH